MPMSLRLRKIDSDEILFDYSPEEFQWWINGFDPSHQYANADNLELQVTIDFPCMRICIMLSKRHGVKKVGSLTICKQHILGEINKYL